MDKAQAIQFDACIPPSWWEFTVAHAVHLYNRTPVQQIKYKMPHEMLKLQRPDVSYFRVFGYGAYVFLPEEVRQNKSAPKSELMTFIGYADGVKGYLFMRSTNYIFTAVKALFNENVYPRCPHVQHPDFIDIRPPSDNSDHNTPLGDDTNDNNDWFDDLHDLPVRKNTPHCYDDMSNPSDPDKSVDNGNKEPMLTTPKEKQRAVGPPTTPRLDRRNPDPEQGNTPVSPMPSNAPHLPQDNPIGLQPRKSGRMRQPPKPREDNLYGEWNPVDWQRMSTRDWRKLQRDDPAPPDTNQSKLSPEDMMAQMAQEGGVSLIIFRFSLYHTFTPLLLYPFYHHTITLLQGHVAIHAVAL